MGWVDYYRRRALIDAALRQAACAPDLRPAFDDIPGMAEAFANPRELVLALHYQWTRKLLARIEVGLMEAEGRDDMDQADVVAKAWLGLAAEEPVLRGVLDVYEADPDQVLQSALAREYHMLALSAGLARWTQTDDTIAGIGAVWRASLRPGSHSVVRSRGA